MKKQTQIILIILAVMVSLGILIRFQFNFNKFNNSSNASLLAETTKLNNTTNLSPLPLSETNNPLRHIDWPRDTKKEETLEHCAELLRSSVNKSQIELLYNKLTNSPALLQRTYRTNASNLEATSIVYFVTNSDMVAHLKNFSSQLTLNLTEFANLLTSKELVAYAMQGNPPQYYANIQNPYNPNEMFIYSFFTINGPVQEIEIRADNGTKVIANAIFYENGQLKLFSIDKGYETISFNKGGQLDNFFFNLYSNVAVKLRLDDLSSIKILTYNSSGLPKGKTSSP